MTHNPSRRGHQGLVFAGVIRLWDIWLAMLLAVPIHLAVGVSFAWAAASLHRHEATLRSSPFWSLTLFQLLLVTPTLAYVGWVAPRWAMLDLFTVSKGPLLIAMSALPAVAGLGGFLLGRRLCVQRPRGRLITGLIALGAIAVSAGLFALTFERWWYVPDAVGGARELPRTSIAYLAGGMVLVWCVGAISGLARIIALARAYRQQPGAVPIPARDGKTQALEGPPLDPVKASKRKSGGKKKASAGSAT